MDTTIAQETPVVIRKGRTCVLPGHDHCAYERIKKILFRVLNLEENTCRACAICPLQTLSLKVEIEDDEKNVQIVPMNILEFYEYIEDKKISRHMRQGKPREQKFHDMLARRHGELTVKVDLLRRNCR